MPQLFSNKITTTINPAATTSILSPPITSPEPPFPFSLNPPKSHPSTHLPPPFLPPPSPNTLLPPSPPISPHHNLFSVVDFQPPQQPPASSLSPPFSSVQPTSAASPLHKSSRTTTPPISCRPTPPTSTHLTPTTIFSAAVCLLSSIHRPLHSTTTISPPSPLSSLPTTIFFLHIAAPYLHHCSAAVAPLLPPQIPLPPFPPTAFNHHLFTQFSHAHHHNAVLFTTSRFRPTTRKLHRSPSTPSIAISEIAKQARDFERNEGKGREGCN